MDLYKFDPGQAAAESCSTFGASYNGAYTAESPEDGEVCENSNRVGGEDCTGKRVRTGGGSETPPEPQLSKTALSWTVGCKLG